MSVTLLVSKNVCRSKFQKEDYIGEDDILALVISGSFQFDNGNGMQTVGPLEGVNFQRGIRYHRHILQKAQIYLFRYRAQEDFLGCGKVVFQDLERIHSTVQMLQLCDSLTHQDDFTYKQALFTDIVNQFRLEQASQYQALLNTDSVILSAVSFIRDNLHRKMNFAELAEQYFLSYIQFSRRFKKTTGTTPQEYVAGLRLKKAKQLLAETDLSIQKIADSCGFSNGYYFCNFFRKHCQLPPSQYRVLVNTVEEGGK